jgi:hypothetical protein
MRMVVCVVVVLVVASIAHAQGGTQSLPPAVKSAFDQAYPGATISAATQERDNNRTVFRVDSLHKGKRRIVVYDSNGALIETAEQVEEKELPQPVAAAMHSHRRAIYISGFKVTRGSNVEYRLTVRGSRKTAMVAQPDGTVLSFK